MGATAKLVFGVLKSSLLIFKVVSAQEGNRVLQLQCLLETIINLILVVLRLL